MTIESLSARILMLVVLLGATCAETFAGKPVGQPQQPSVDFVLPWRVVAGSSRVRITVHGKGLEECSVVTVGRAANIRDVPAHLVSHTLVFTLPDDLTATPGEVSVKVGATSATTNATRIEVVKASGPTQLADPFISKVTPEESAVSATVKARLFVYGENIDPKALVFLRPEGNGSTGVRLEAAPASGKARLEVAVMADSLQESGAYELRVVNPTARQSNWVRVQMKVLSAEN